ncbi:MFS transporter [Pseudoxanthomonas sp. X-1]|uniref:MFS transporter n=1 Tax=Pseudoxanthomonas sp. X-1 TaxID=2571115 RepID=UPI001CC78F96|nr:MFS transporter [Pseudoxanthomonas sp. X-1]
MAASHVWRRRFVHFFISQRSECGRWRPRPVLHCAGPVRAVCSRVRRGRHSAVDHRALWHHGRRAGWLVGLFALVVAVCGPAMVLWPSRFDRRKVLAGALLAFALCSLLSAWAPDFGVLMALRVPLALLHPVFFSVAFAAAVSLYPRERATHATAMAFVGTSMGLVLGVPLTAWIEAQVSYEASFYFCAIVNLAAAAGVWIMLPPRDVTEAGGRGQPFAVLRKPVLWLSIGMAVCVFGAMFSVYSYTAEYLARETGLGGEAISVLLVVFGVGGVLGNLLAGRWLGRNLVGTVLGYPIALALAYAVLQVLGSPSFAAMLPVCLLWGAAHTSGLIVSQVWMASSAPEAPEFVTSLYVSAANFGVVFGSAVGGGLITWAGMPGAIWSGWLFATLAVMFVVARRGLGEQAE